jgi:subtilisin family serine protease
MRLLTKGVLVCVLLVGSLSADQRFIVRVLGGLPALNDACSALACSVLESLEAPDEQLFLIATPDGPVGARSVSRLSGVLGVVDIEPDLLVSVTHSDRPVPSVLFDSQPVPYFGVNVQHDYVSQPAARIVRIQETQTTFGDTGTGTVVAIIDTGVDPNHPALRNVLVPGYDFTRNLEGYGSEDQSTVAVVDQSTVAVVDQSTVAVVDQSTVAVVDQSTVAVVDQSTVGVVDHAGAVFVNSHTVATVGQSNASLLNNPQNAAFGHGTMVAGIVHLVAPQAMIMPFKAFGADGTGYTSDILRAIYRATSAGARVINMSFGTKNPSTELRLAVDYATTRGVICVASAGNQGLNTLAYPAALQNVIGVASTTNDDTRSTFSNYGQKLVWVAAPGEGIITTYPFGAYAATWGTSFSAPFVSGTAALLLQVRWNMGYSDAAEAIAYAKPINSGLGHGRLDTFLAVQAAKSPQF